MIVDILCNEHQSILHEYLKKHSSVIMLLLDQELRILTYNQGFLKLCGDRQEPAGTLLADYLMEESKGEFLQTISSKSGSLRLSVWGQGESSYIVDGYHYRLDENKYLVFWEIVALSSSEIIQKFSVLNNELTNIIRELNKKNNELEKANNTINRLLQIDPLTNIYNRRYFMEAIGKAFSLLSRYHISSALVMADLDNFKSVNDQWGHNTGDKVLIAFAALLQNLSREVDAPARIGGEEFMILLNHTTFEQAHKFAERVRKTWNKQIIPPLNVPLSASFGVTQLKVSDSVDAAMIRADKALYEAKEKGKNRVEGAE